MREAKNSFVGFKTFHWERRILLCQILLDLEMEYRLQLSGKIFSEASHNCQHIMLQMSAIWARGLIELTKELIK